MKQWMDAYREVLASDSAVSDNTRLSYGRDLDDFAAAMERLGVSEPGRLQTAHIRLYLQQLRQTGKSAATIARRFVTIRGLCRFGVVRRLLALDPTLDIEAPRTEQKRARALSYDAVKQLLEAARLRSESPSGLRDAAMLELLYASGLRVSELIALDTTHVRTDLAMLQGVGDRRERIVPVGQAAIRLLERYMAEGRPALLKPDRPQEALFLNRLGARMTRQGCWKIFRQIAREAGVEADLTPRALRGSFAAHLLENGADVRAVQEMMGHASPLSTLSYRDGVKAKIKEAYDRAHPRAR